MKETWIQRTWKQFTSPVSLNWELDDLGPVFPGSAISGRIVLNVQEDQVEVLGLVVAMDLNKMHKRSFHERCADCTKQTIQVDMQALLAQPTTFCHGRHEFRFDISIPDDFPPSLTTSILATTYEIRAKACIYKVNATAASKIMPTNINVNRIVCIEEPPHMDILPHYSSHNVSRTGIRVSTYCDPLISLHRPNHVSMTIDGLMSPVQMDQGFERWRLMKGAWSIDETVNVKFVSQSCKRHTSRTTRAEEQEVIYTNTVRLGGKELYDGWKDCERIGSVDFDFDFGFKPDHKIHSHIGYAGGLGSPLGFEVIHSLVVELVFVLEHFPEGRPDQTIRTGQARISQMPFRVFLSRNHDTGTSSSRDRLPCYNDEWSLPPHYHENDPSRI